MFRRITARVDAVFVQAVIAGALSFAHLQEIAEAAGQTGWKAWAYPISVDLLLVAAWRRIRSGRAVGISTVTPWVWFVIALAASLGANVATAGVLDLNDVPEWLRFLVAGWPALAFFGGTLLAHSTPPATPEPEPAAPEKMPDSPVTVERAPAPAEPAPVQPSLPAAPQSSPRVPPALVEHARKISAAHQKTTGERIDTATLAARLGVPPPMAEVISTQLA